jgi:hypothetical protein
MGDYFNFVTGGCVPCGLGMYQVEGQRDVCYNCPDGKTTRETGTQTSKLDGSDVCYGKPDAATQNFLRQHSLIITIPVGYRKCINI